MRAKFMTTKILIFRANSVEILGGGGDINNAYRKNQKPKSEGKYE